MVVGAMDRVSLAYLLAASAPNQRMAWPPAGEADAHIAELQRIGLLDGQRGVTLIGRGIAERAHEQVVRWLTELGA